MIVQNCLLHGGGGGGCKGDRTPVSSSSGFSKEPRDALLPCGHWIPWQHDHRRRNAVGPSTTLMDIILCADRVEAIPLIDVEAVVHPSPSMLRRERTFDAFVAFLLLHLLLFCFVLLLLQATVNFVTNAACGVIDSVDGRFRPSRAASSHLCQAVIFALAAAVTARDAIVQRMMASVLLLVDVLSWCGLALDL